ncbi:hypothetical protein [Streptomyces sp. NPDC048496]|uniref:hypothetical protein n=1 Tax=Streptomyces sp. NPDC048496 TaxID=3365558 RepID=UPI00371A6271
MILSNVFRRRPGTDEVDLLPGEYDAIRCWYDTEDGTGTSVLRRAGDLSVGEPVFAPAVGHGSDGDGYRMAYATDLTEAHS